eukprot:377299-Pelagomonas_calceolata.AAC.1
MLSLLVLESPTPYVELKWQQLLRPTRTVHIHTLFQTAKEEKRERTAGTSTAPAPNPENELVA